MMTLRKLQFTVLALLVLLGTKTMAAKPEPITMLVIPAHYSVVQVAMDVYRYYPTILVSYQAGENGDDPVLYVWDGRGEWLYVSCEDYLSGRFFSRPPERAVLVGDEGVLPPLLADGPLWVKKVVKIPTIKTPQLLNSLGRVYDFDPYTWKWFAKRFNLELVDINAPARSSSWYDGSFVEKTLPDGKVEKVYIPPEGSEIEANDIEILDVQGTGVPGMIPLKAEPPRMAEELYIDVEDVEPDVYELIEEDVEETTWDDGEGDSVTVIDSDIKQETFVVTPTPAPPAGERSVFFEYTEEDMENMGGAK